MFQLVKKNFEIMGISPDRSIQLYVRSVLVFLQFGVCIMLSIAYLFYIANSFEQNIELIYTISTEIVAISCLAILIRKTKKLFRFINRMEGLIQKSK